MADESLVVLPPPLVRPFFTRPQLVRHSTRTEGLLSALIAGDVVPRARAEREESMTQAVAYATLRSGDGLVCLRRSSRQRKELDDRWTVVFGGHVNPDERDGLAGLRRCLRRELGEEFGEVILSLPEFIGVVADPDSEVGRRHLGFVFEIQVVAHSLSLDRRFDNHDYSLIPGRRCFSKMDRLFEDDPSRFDPWSRLVLREYELGGSVKRRTIRAR